MKTVVVKKWVIECLLNFLRKYNSKTHHLVMWAHTDKQRGFVFFPFLFIPFLFPPTQWLTNSHLYVSTQTYGLTPWTSPPLWGSILLVLLATLVFDFYFCFQSFLLSGIYHNILVIILANLKEAHNGKFLEEAVQYVKDHNKNESKERQVFIIVLTFSHYHTSLFPFYISLLDFLVENCVTTSVMSHLLYFNDF